MRVSVEATQTQTVPVVHRREATARMTVTPSTSPVDSARTTADWAQRQNDHGTAGARYQQPRQSPAPPTERENADDDDNDDDKTTHRAAAAARRDPGRPMGKSTTRRRRPVDRVTRAQRSSKNSRDRRSTNGRAAAMTRRDETQTTDDEPGWITSSSSRPAGCEPKQPTG